MMLRMQCSSLNHHLFRKNIVNSPFCQCGATETTAHFLLHCPRHNATRLRYIHTINLPINLNTDLLLFGSTYTGGYEIACVERCSSAYWRNTWGMTSIVVMDHAAHFVNVGQQKLRPIFCYIVPITMQQDWDIFTPLIYQLT
jgi:hypothetical protein